MVDKYYLKKLQPYGFTIFPMFVLCIRQMMLITYITFSSFLTASSFQNEWFTVWQSFQFPPRTKFVLVCNFITCKVFCLEDSFQMHFPSKLLTFSILTLNTLLFISILKLPCIWLYDRDMGKYVSLWIFEIFVILLLFPYRWMKVFFGK